MMSGGHCADSGPCLTTLSEGTTEIDIYQHNELDLYGQESGNFRMLMAELNWEIDQAPVFGVTDMQGIISHKIKALMLDVLTESYQNLHLSEHLRSTVLQAVREYQSEIGTMRMQLAEPKQHLIRAEEEEEENVCTELQKKLCIYENTMQSLQLEVSSAQHCIQSLIDHLHQSEDSAQSLNMELKEKQENVHLLNQKLFSAHESTKFIQTDLDVYENFSCRLQQKLSVTEEQHRALQEALMACKALVQEAEKEQQQDIESKEECESKIRNMYDILKALNNCIEHSMSDLQGQLKMALKRERV